MRPTSQPARLPTESHKAQSHPGREGGHISEGGEGFTAPVVSVGPATVEVGEAVHGQAGHAVQEVCEGQVDVEDVGVLQRSPVESEYLVGLSPWDGQESQEVTSSSNDCHQDTEDPGYGGQHSREGVVGLGAGATVTAGRHCQSFSPSPLAAPQTTGLDRGELP